MADQKNSNQVVRELKWLDVKETYPSIINVLELTDRNANEELHTSSMISIINVLELTDRNANEQLHTSSITPLSPGPVHVQSKSFRKEKPQPTTTNQPKYPSIS